MCTVPVTSKSVQHQQPCQMCLLHQHAGLDKQPASLSKTRWESRAVVLPAPPQGSTGTAATDVLSLTFTRKQPCWALMRCEGVVPGCAGCMAQAHLSQ